MGPRGEVGVDPLRASECCRSRRSSGWDGGRARKEGKEKRSERR